MQTDDRPIGIFDSGIGGLTVLRALLGSFKHESFIYLGDTARLPYGSKSPATIDRYLMQNIRFLQKQNVKAIVVACNTASTVLISHEREFSLPVYDVIRPGAQAALKASASRRIGVLATRATVTSKSYTNALLALDPQVSVYSQAAPLLVPLVEEGWEDDPLTNLVIFRYIQPLLNLGIDTLILGCTHYPALRGAIGRVTGPNVALIESSEAIQKLMAADFASGRLKPSSKRHQFKLLVTDDGSTFAEVAARLMRPHQIPQLELVDTHGDHHLGT